MDKCREEFEQYIRDQSAFTADFQIGCNGQYKSDLMHFMFVTWQHQQAKVEELKATIKGNHGRIAELERLNRVKAQAIIDLHQEITELKASHHGEVIGHEVHLKKIKQERDELQKRVDSLEKVEFKLVQVKAILQNNPKLLESILVKKLEQALKGEG
ncbi:hypothetical protein NQ663_13895 [Acinetobacter baumannii]|nr:hypothetical protein [Acinetobacter baumannii]